MNPSTLSDDDFYPLIEARHFDPFKLLGIREFQGSLFGRVFRPDAAEVTVVDVSDSGMQREAFVVVEVEGMAELMIVPVECILSMP